jgi:uncharacterized protein YecE (DUF72 family)
MKVAGAIRVGISGWRYRGWRGTFYPPALPQRAELSFAASRFNTIELNGTFYSLQRADSFVRWREETPEGFVFAVKGSRYLTHMMKLKAIERGLANFFAQGVLALGEKLGPILWQFPPQWKFNPERLEEFFASLPRTHREAAELGQQHGPQLHGPAWLEVDRDRPLRHAMEVRHESFVCEEFIRLLRRHRVASVVADTVAWPRLMDVTADFVYCRLHGDKQLYASGYGPKAIDAWAQRVTAWAAGGEAADGTRASEKNARARRTRDVYVYFDNDAKVRAPVDAACLMRRIEASMQPAANGPRVGSGNEL